MRGCVWWAGAAVIATLLGGLPAGGAAAGYMIRFAQNASDPAPGVPAAGTPAALRANSSEQIRKAQTELRRLDCLKGRIDGKLGDQTRQAVKNFWTSAKQPVVEVSITDELIADLAERGDNFCRPPRRFFGFGGRPGGMPFFPGARPIPVPAKPVPSPSPEATQ